MNAETGACDGFWTFTKDDIIHFFKFWEWCSPLPCNWCALRLIVIIILTVFGLSILI
jgi:hypothetical protein